jgi:hypothetical protein
LKVELITSEIMTSTVNLEKRLIVLDREIHSILGLVKKQRIKELGDVVDKSSGAWGYHVDSAEFVEGLRKSKRLDWIK